MLVNKVLYQMHQPVRHFASICLYNFTHFVLLFHFDSTASAEDPQCSTPKSRKNDYNQSHLTPPSATPTPHDFDDMGSPTWQRTTASPVSLENRLSVSGNSPLNSCFLATFRYSTAMVQLIHRHLIDRRKSRIVYVNCTTWTTIQIDVAG